MEKLEKPTKPSLKNPFLMPKIRFLMPQKLFLDLNLKPRRGRLTLRGFYHPNAGKMTPSPEKMTPRRCWAEAGGVGQ
jgi:hypothetical protein